MRYALALGGVALLSALVKPGPAAAQAGIASMPLAQAAKTRRCTLGLGESVIQPPPVLSHPPPVYPQALLARGLPPIDIPAQWAVDGAGRVYHLSVSGEARADAAYQALIAAIRTAAANWRFSPLVVHHLAADAEGHSHLVDSEQPLFRQFFVFHFQQRGGRPPTGDASVR